MAVDKENAADWLPGEGDWRGLYQEALDELAARARLIAALTAERDRLRAALEKIEAYRMSPFSGIARDALGETEEMR